jgi:acyl-CoA reductase-like NAD-dependent aldehyde dehydrogenase
VRAVVAVDVDSVYGLVCVIWTGDYQHAWCVARAIDAGSVWINTYK